MTPFKNFSTNKTFTQRIRKGGLYVAVSAMLAAQISCGSDNGGDWEEVTTYQPTKGVITTIEESATGSFEIVDEQIVPTSAASRVIVRKQNGQSDTLTLDQAKGMVQSQDTIQKSQQTHHQTHSFGRSLWWGSMGYMMGRSFSSPNQPSYYRNGGAGFAGGGFNRISNIASELRTTSTPSRVMRPVSGRSGFFRGGRSSGSSYGG
jgi:hypothetical protein